MIKNRFVHLRDAQRWARERLLATGVTQVIWNCGVGYDVRENTQEAPECPHSLESRYYPDGNGGCKVGWK